LGAQAGSPEGGSNGTVKTQKFSQKGNLCSSRWERGALQDIELWGRWGRDQLLVRVSAKLPHRGGQGHLHRGTDKLLRGKSSSSGRQKGGGVIGTTGTSVFVEDGKEWGYVHVSEVSRVHQRGAEERGRGRSRRSGNAKFAGGR